MCLEKIKVISRPKRDDIDKNRKGRNNLGLTPVDDRPFLGVGGGKLASRGQISGLRINIKAQDLGSGAI